LIELQAQNVLQNGPFSSLDNYSVLVMTSSIFSLLELQTMDSELDTFKMLGRLVGAFVRIAPAIAGVADASTAHKGH
jgi:hypothetical protein